MTANSATNQSKDEEKACNLETEHENSLESNQNYFAINQNNESSFWLVAAPVLEILFGGT